MNKKVKIGVVGCGNISGIYFSNLTEKFTGTEVYACADLIENNAKKAAEKYNIAHIMDFEDMLDSKEIDIILNLTTPQTHYSITKKALLAGKHVYSEKPLALTFSDGQELCRIATENNLFLGCAPDTFMGAGIQTARKAIDDGLVGSIIGGNAFMMCHGHESWHPNPDFYYKSGGGPMLDMGPYYLTALVNLLGSIKEIERMSSRAMNTRTIASQARYGEKIDVEVQTHVCGLLKFDCGAICTITTSFDVWKHSMPKIELYGTKGSIKVPDPNNFGGDVLCSGEINDFGIFSSVYGYAENSRGLGLSDMADCILGNRKVPRANSETALHVLEAMCALIDENGAGKYVMRTKANIQEPMPEM